MRGVDKQSSGSMSNRVENTNPKILRQCREQLGMTIEEAARKVRKIPEIENGDVKPTFKQLDTLAELYQVPRWVFVNDKLPEQYQLEQLPVFRTLAHSNTNAVNNSKVRTLLIRTERLRRLIIELREDMEEPVEGFKGPDDLRQYPSPEQLSESVRRWLNTEQDNFSFPEWKERIEDRGIFVFMTSKYSGWSHVDAEVFRGFSIYYSKLPVIIINDSDAKKAQSFTLFHELGHLLRKETVIDDSEMPDSEEEQWCDQFAGNVLMPEVPFRATADSRSITGFHGVKRLAGDFKVSPYACLVRLRQLRIISQDFYEEIDSLIKNEYKALRERFKSGAGGPSRDRAKEAIDQYGRLFSRTVFQAYHNQEIGLHKLCRLLDLKQPSHALKMTDML